MFCVEQSEKSILGLRGLEYLQNAIINKAWEAFFVDNCVDKVVITGAKKCTLELAKALLEKEIFEGGGRTKKYSYS